MEKNKLKSIYLMDEARNFCEIEAKIDHTELLGITDGKAVGTYVEHKFKKYLKERYDFDLGNLASGIDLPDKEVNTDIKVTSIRQPQSSCPYKDSKQKIYGLGYNLLIFVYEKIDTENECRLKFLNCTFVEYDRTADYTTTKKLNEMINDGANKEDIISYFIDRAIPGDEITLSNLAELVLENKPKQGYLTISNALQWRLQYSRVISLNNKIEGINNIDFT